MRGAGRSRAACTSRIEQRAGSRARRIADTPEGLIVHGKVVSYTDTGQIQSVEITLPEWLYREMTEGPNPDVLTVHRDYFLIEPGIGRFLYRLARRAAGKGQANGRSSSSTNAAVAPALSKSSAASCVSLSLPTIYPSTTCGRKPARAVRCSS